MQIKRFTFSPFQINTYIVFDQSKECVIIDPGCYNDTECQQLANYISENNLKPVRILQTHCHLDHVFGSKFVCESYNLEPEAHKEEVLNNDYASDAAELYGLTMEEPYPLKHFLTEADKITFGNSELKILHIPGHTAGSLVYYSLEHNFALAGDVLFKGSIGRTDLPGGDYRTLVAGIKEKFFNLPDAMTVYPGHGEATTIGEEKRLNPFVGSRSFT